MAAPGVERAYSLLHIKAIQDDRRIISGIATTPEPDRVGDIVEPLGVTFKNPLPLLLYHDHTRPVGTVRFAKPTEDGLAFTAQLPKVEEPGTLKDRVDEAWQLVKLGIVRGVSIGFRTRGPDSVEPLRTGGVRFLATEVLELSLVPVPANTDAVIDTIKSFDVSRPAAPGSAPDVRPPTSGASDLSRRTAMKQNVSEKLTARKAELQTKAARLTELRELSDGESLDRAQQDEAATLTTEIKALTGEIDQLTALESVQRVFAEPVVATNEKTAAQSRDGQPGRPRIEMPPLPQGIEFARAIQCKMASLLSQGAVSALDVAKMRFPDFPRIQAFFKAAVTPHTSGDGANTGGTELVYAQNLVGEFIDFLRPTTIIGKFGTGNIPSLNRVPFNSRINGLTSGGSAAWVGQGKLKPVTKYNFNAVSLSWAKVAAITVQSDELARFSSPSSEMLLRNALAGSIRERLDIDFIDPTKTASVGVSPASITNGVTALTESGTDAAAVRSDIGQLVSAFITANNPLNAGVIITSQSIALQLSLMRNALGQREFPDITMNGGMLEGFPVITSQYAAVGSPPAHVFALVNAEDIFLADDGQVSIDVSREASIEMSDDPENESGTVVSMFQANLMALRAERYINWARRRDSAVAYFDAAAYASGSA